MRAKTAEDRALLEMIDPVAESLGLAVVRVRLMGGTLRRRLQIMAERMSDGDMGIDDCTKLSRALSALRRSSSVKRRRAVCHILKAA